ncbi:MAG: sialidase family protein [Thermoplasmatota archaeon]
MRPLWILAAIAAVAGCVTPTGLPSPSTHLATLSTGGWTLDCSLGSYEHAMNASWGQTCEARASHTPGPKEETWIAINPTNPDNVVIGAKDLNPASSNHCVWNGVFVTHDGGKSWKDVVIGGAYKDRKPGDPTYGYACNTDPDFQFTKDGALHYGVEMYAPQGIALPDGPVIATPSSQLATQGFKILLATSRDGGDTWPQIITFQPDLGFTTDYSRMIVVPTTQTIVEAIGSDGGVGCHILRSTDGGKTADFRPIVTKDGIPCGSGGDTAIAASPTGTLVLIGGIARPDPASLAPGASSSTSERVVVRSTDDGLTWTDSNLGFPFVPIGPFNESKYRVGSNFELAYDLTNGSRSGTLYVAYASHEDHNESTIFVRSSKDDGRTWSPAVRVNPNPTGAHQWMPGIAVASDGSVHVFYMDKEFDPQHVLIDITHAVSLDGGKTWTNERVSTIPYEGNLGLHQDGFPFIGDYLGVAAYGDHVWAGFPDASNGKTTVVAAAHVMLGSN